MESNDTEPALDVTTGSPPAAMLEGSTSSMDHGTLRVFAGDDSYKDYRINAGENKIGRKESDCDVFIHSRGLSRVHCSILVDNGEHFIMDHESSNLTHRRSHCLRPSVFYELTDRCELFLANIRCVYYHGDIPSTPVGQEDDENVEAYEAETDNSTPASPADSKKLSLVPSSLPAHSALSGVAVGDKAKDEKEALMLSPHTGDRSGSSTCGEPSPSPTAQRHGLVIPSSPCLEEPSSLPLLAAPACHTLPYSPEESSPPILATHDDHRLLDPTVPYEADEIEPEDKTTTTTTTTTATTATTTTATTTTTTTTTERTMQESANDDDGDNKGSQLVETKEQLMTLSPVAASKAESALQTCLFEEDEKLPASNGDDTLAEAGAVQEEQMDTGVSSESPAEQVAVSAKKRGGGGRRRGRPPGGRGRGGRTTGRQTTKETTTPSSRSATHQSHTISDESPDLPTEINKDTEAPIPASSPPSSSYPVSQQSTSPDDFRPVRRTPTRRAARGKGAQRSRVDETRADPVKKSPRSSHTLQPSNSPNHTPEEAPRVMFTGLIDEHGARAVEEMGGTLVHSAAACTHLVTDKVRRTIKFLCCLARGCLIVQTKWLDECRAQGKFVPADGFLLKDRAAERQHNFTLSKSITAARASPLLLGWKVHMTDGIKPSPAEMGEIITSAGGEVISDMPSSVAENVLVVSTDDELARCQPALSAGVPVCSTEVILGGILRQQIDTTAHQLETDNKKRKGNMQPGSAAKRRRR